MKKSLSRIGVLVPFLAAAALSARAQGPILRVEPGGHTAEVRQVIFLPGGRELVTVGKDKVVRIWDIRTGKHKAIRYQIGPGIEGQLFCAALGGVKKNVLAVGEAGKNGAILLFDLTTGEQLKRISGQSGTVSSVAFSPDSSRLISTGAGIVRAWDLRTGKIGWEKRVQKALPNARGPDDYLNYYVFSACFSPDGQRVAAGSVDGNLRIWQAADGNEVAKVQFGKEVLATAWSSQGMLACGTRDGVIRFWNPGSSDEPVRLQKQPDAITSLAFTQDGGRLISGSGENGTDFVVRVWSIPDGKLVSKFDRHPATVFTVASSDNGELAASGDAYGEIFVWDLATGQERYALKGSGGSAFTVAWSRDAKQVAWGGEFQGPLGRAFQLDKGLPSLALESSAGWAKAEHKQGSRALEMSADGKSLLLKEGKRELKMTPEPDDQIKCFGFTPDGRVVAGSDLYLVVEDTTGKSKKRILEGHQGSVLSISASPDGKFLATGSADQTVRIWDLRPNASDFPLLNIFTDSQGEWIAWTQPGYYAASPNGDEMIGWHVNRGLDRTAEFHSAYQFRKIFYRPDVIQRVLAAGSVQEALRLADAARPQKTDPLKVAENISKMAPPTVEITSPPEGFAATQADIIVRAKVLDPSQKDVALRLTVSGSRTLGLQAAPLRPGEFELKARLVPGQNTISVVSINDSGESRPAQVRVTFQAPAQDKPDLYLFVVGVSKYQGSGISQLDYAAIDAESFANIYKEQKGKLFANVHARSILDAQVTRQSVQEGLSWIKSEAKEKDYVAIFVSGHGFVEKDRYFFAPSSTNLAKLAETAIPWSEVIETIRKFPCRVLLAIDTCHSGGVAVEALRDPYNSLLRQSKEAGLITLSACMPGELSWEDARWGHGAFTFAFLEALGGKAPTEDDGTLSLIQVAAYVNRQVTKLTNKKQTSKLHADPNIPDNLPLAKVR